jgi:A/G-specific adenine glycosylase
LKGQWIFPGEIAREKAKPKDYNARHNITHHDIFIQINPKKSLNQKGVQWVELKELKKVNPSSLLTKVLKQVEK